MVAKGAWPKTTSSLVLSSGTISNVNFVAIPANARNKLAAAVVGDFIGSTQVILYSILAQY